MASVNKVILVGNLGRDPESRYMPNGDCVCNIAIATTESWKDKNTGEKKEQTEWHRIVLFRKLGEIAAEYLVKGSSVYIEGKLATRKWTDKDGIERYTTEIVADSMQMLGSPRHAQHDDHQEDEHRTRPSAPRNGNGARSGPASRQGTRPAPNFSDMDDDIPF